MNTIVDRPYRVFNISGGIWQLINMFYYDPVPPDFVIESKVNHTWCTKDGNVVLKVQFDPEGSTLTFHNMSLTSPEASDSFETVLELTPEGHDFHHHFLRVINEVIIDQEIKTGTDGCILKVTAAPGTYKLRSPRIRAQVIENNFKYVTKKNAEEEMFQESFQK